MSKFQVVLWGLIALELVLVWTASALIAAVPVLAAALYATAGGVFVCMAYWMMKHRIAC